MVGSDIDILHKNQFWDKYQNSGDQKEDKNEGVGMSRFDFITKKKSQKSQTEKPRSAPKKQKLVR